MLQFVRVKLQVTGLHHWPEAPEKTSFLRQPHRHQFIIEVDVPVSHGNRDLEFFTFQEQLRLSLYQRYAVTERILDLHDFGAMSCEMIAAWLLEEFPEAVRCTVSEDGENLGGAMRLNGHTD